MTLIYILFSYLAKLQLHSGLFLKSPQYRCKMFSQKLQCLLLQLWVLLPLPLLCTSVFIQLEARIALFPWKYYPKQQAQKGYCSSSFPSKNEYSLSLIFPLPQCSRNLSHSYSNYLSLSSILSYLSPFNLHLKPYI